MKNSKNALLVAAVGGAVLLGAAAFFLFDLPAPKSISTPAAKITQEKVKPPVVPAAQQVTVVPLQLQQQGLYAIDKKTYASASLASQYTFVAEGIKTEVDPYAPDITLEPQLPKNIDVAEIHIPSKNLTMVVVYAGNSEYCSGEYCLFSLYVKRPDGFQNYIGHMAAKNQYVMVSDKSVSIITCESSAGYNEWRLGDGTLDGPIPPNSPGHFVPVGTFKHDKVAPCP